MDNEKIPCCATDALWRIKKINVNGVMTRISSLDESIATVQSMNLPTDSAIRTALLGKIRGANYIPPAVEEAYAAALMEEYRKASSEKHCSYGCGGSKGE
jgi:hypothetical protein